jgi:hypothetical protein
MRCSDRRQFVSVSPLLILILILMTGRPMELNWPAEHIPAILNIWYSNTETGTAEANLLLGDVVRQADCRSHGREAPARNISTMRTI